MPTRECRGGAELIDGSRLARTSSPVSHVDFQAREVLLLLYLSHPHEAWPASKGNELGWKATA